MLFPSAAAAGRAITTKSQSGKPFWQRKASRASRLSRFRATALLATRFETASPSRGTLESFSFPKTVKNLSAQRSDPLNNRAKSFDLFRRAQRQESSDAGTDLLTPAPRLKVRVGIAPWLAGAE